MTQSKPFFCTLFLLLYTLCIKAQDTLVYPTDSSFLKVGPYCVFYKDEQAALNFEQIKDIPDDLFKKLPLGNLTFGNTKASIWVKFITKNQTAEPLFLTFWSFGFTTLDVYTITENGQLTVRKSGAYHLFSGRDLKRGQISINIGQIPKAVYINLKSKWALNTDVSISALKPLSNIYYGRDTFNGICMGILIAMALYNLFLFFSVKESLYLFYFTYILVALLAVSQLNTTYQFFIGWGSGVGTRELFSITGIIFSMRFLNTRNTIPWGHKALWGFVGIFCLSFILKIFNRPTISNQIYNITAIFSLFTAFFLGILAYRRGNKSALFYTIAWFILICSAFITTVVNMGFLPFTFWTNTSLAIGTCLETILLAFALAHRLKEYRDASEAAQKLAFQRLEENEQLVTEQKNLLEDKVHERTLEIEHSLAKLKSAQTQLIQSEKLASLGELTAGIAHEIQNPLNFVKNFSELSIDIAKDMQVELGKPEMDKAYIGELFEDLIQNQEKINHHGIRASSIVKGMLGHSRVNTGARELTDINRLAEEYLRLSFHGLRAKDKSFTADFQTNFDETLSKIEVIPQDIGRVILNLINNAFYAVDEKRKNGNNPEYKPCVSVSTANQHGHLVIKIMDNGTGMPESVKAKIFQPFFTTKPTGEGTGLGLSLSYDIITKGHGGTLQVETVAGERTEFIIKLPC